MENENSTTEIQMLCQQDLLSWSKQVQANTLAQLGSNPFKPLLRATADPATPSEGSENGSVLARTTITFSFAVPKQKGTSPSRQIKTHQHHHVSLNPCNLDYGFKVHDQLFSEYAAPIVLKYRDRGFLHQRSLLCSHWAQGEQKLC